MENKHEIDAALEAGAVKAREVANATLERVREKLGY
jgi:tryptophanyl-tRNA synthetase